MPRMVALLRGINVGGRNLVPMTTLRALFVRTGFADVTTLLQSGNVVFSTQRRSVPAIEGTLEKCLSDGFGRHLDCFVRTSDEWTAIVNSNPLKSRAAANPGRLLVMLCRKPVAAAQVATLRKAIAGEEIVHAVDRQLYVSYPDGVGTSKLTSSVIERAIGQPATARNWNTVQRIASLLAEQA